MSDCICNECEIEEESCPVNQAIEKIAELEQQLKQMQWVSVADQLPEIGDVVNIVTTNRDNEIISTSAVRLIPYEGCTTYYWRAGTYWQTMLPERVTHWMPLPEPPKGEK